MDSLYYVYIHVLLLLPNTDRFRGCNWQLKKAKTIYKILNFIFVVLERGDSSLECFNQTTVYSSRAPEFIPVFSGVCVAWFLVFYVVFCRSWFFFFFWPLHCLSSDYPFDIFKLFFFTTGCGSMREKRFLSFFSLTGRDNEREMHVPWLSQEWLTCMSVIF